MGYSLEKNSISLNLIKALSVIFVMIVTIVLMSGNMNASAASVTSLSKPTMISEGRYTSTATHPFNAQTNTIIVRWNAVENANKYVLYIRGGNYSDWTKVATTTSTKAKITGLSRNTTYKFKVRAIRGTLKSACSSVQYIKTARIDFDLEGWKAMCRIVYHEVGGMAGEMWDKPIVYVSDCLVNQYEGAKYTNNATWAPYYRRYNSIQSIIYTSGGFMSSAGLSRDGADYCNVTSRVKKAVWGAVYGTTFYNGIKNDNNVYFWCNRSYYQSSSKIAYSFKIPWGYFNVWREYWG